MTFLMLQTFLLMAAAYFLGAFMGCMWRRVVHHAPDLSEVRSTQSAVAAQRTGDAEAPRIKYVAPNAGVPDSVRFERALSGAGTIGTAEAATADATQPRIEMIEPAAPRVPDPVPPPHAVVPPRPADVAAEAPTLIVEPPRKQPAFEPPQTTPILARPSVAATLPPAAPAPVAPAPVPTATVAPPAPVVPAPSPVKPVVAEAPAPAKEPAKEPVQPIKIVVPTPQTPQTPPAQPVARAPSEQPAAPERPAAQRTSGADGATIAAAAAAAAAAVANAAAARSREPTPETPKPATAPAPQPVEPARPREILVEPVKPVVAEPVKPVVTAPAAPGIPAASPGGMSGVAADVRIGAMPPADREDLTSIRGIDAATARLLNERGVWRYRDIAAWTSRDVDTFNALTSRGRVQTEGWIEQAAVLASGAETDYARRRRKGEAATATPAPAPTPAPALAPAVVTAAPAVAAPAAAAIAPAVVAAVASVAAPAKAPAPAAAATADDLTFIRGIDSTTAKLLHSQGIRGFSDIARWTKTDVEAANRVFAANGRVEREGWIEQAAVLAAGGMTEYARRRKRGEFETAQPAAATVSAPRPPADGQRAASAPAASPAASRPEPAAPVAKAAPERSAVSAANAVAAAVAAAAASANRGAAAPDRKPVASAPSTPAATTSAATASAQPLDQLQRIRGVDSVTAHLLIANGVTRFQQIAGWTGEDVTRFETLIGSSGRIGRENWIEQAQILAGSGAASVGDGDPNATRPARLADAIRENRPPRPEVGALRSVRSEALRTGSTETAKIGAARPPAPGADLKRIRGIGVLIEKKLNALGINSYEQIANWTADDIEIVSQSLDFRGRIERENWIEQARILAAGGQTEFSRRLDRSDS